MDNYSLADIAAASGGRERFGDDMWFLILFLLIGRRDLGGGEALTRAEMFDGFNYNQLESAVRGIQQGLCDGFYAQNTTMLQGFGNVSKELCKGFGDTIAAITNNGFMMKDCCWGIERSIDSLKAENYRNTCEIKEAIHAEGEVTRGLIQANTIQDLRDRLEQSQRENLTNTLVSSNQAQTLNLIETLRPYPTPAYITCSPYTAARTNNCGCGCGCDCNYA